MQVLEKFVNIVAWKVFFNTFCKSQLREVKGGLHKCFFVCFMQYLTINLRQVNWKMQRSWWSKQFKPYSPVRMGWECAFLYSLWKVLEKWLQFLVWTLLCSFFCNLYRSTQSFTNFLFLIIYLQASWSNPSPKNWKRLRSVVETVVYVTIVLPYLVIAKETPHNNSQPTLSQWFTNVLSYFVTFFVGI